MRSDTDIKLLLTKVEKLIERIVYLKNPPDEIKTENGEFKALIAQKYMYQWLLGDDGIDFNASYDHLNEYLNILEKKEGI